MANRIVKAFKFIYQYLNKTPYEMYIETREAILKAISSGSSTDILYGDGTWGPAPPKIGGGLYYKFDPGVGATDAGLGKLKYNSALASAVTAIYLSGTSQEGMDVSSVILSLAANQKIIIRQEDNPAKAQLFTVSGAIVNNTTWFTIPVTFVSTGTGGIPLTNKEVTLSKV